MLLTNDNICMSGGAIGADLQWGAIAGCMGHTVIHWGFAGHRTDAPPQEVVKLTDEQLDVANEHCKRASLSLKRYYPPKSEFVKNLLRRNYYQICESDRVYAIAEIVDNQVQGGTAWAVQMFIDKNNGDVCEVYVFDQDQDCWFMWGGAIWVAVDQPPTPHGVWAGIGTRKLRDNGKNAIRAILGWTKDKAPA
jgi:hypothetical protein